MTDATETHGDRVKLRILEMGVRLWMVDPSFVSARRIAHELGMTHAAVLYHFGTSRDLKNALAFHAVKQGEARVIVQLIAMQHNAVAHMSDRQRQSYIRLAATY